ncbi:Hit family protein 1 [Fusarium oxysporum f. sp. albedinis]|nr:Hit family protein 1 [Fusarium oxysporum f. sp. albedinis]
MPPQDAIQCDATYLAIESIPTCHFRYVSTADEEEQSEEDEDAEEEEEEDEEDDEADAKGELLSMSWKSSPPIHTSIPSIHHVPSYQLHAEPPVKKRKTTEADTKETNGDAEEEEEEEEEEGDDAAEAEGDEEDAEGDEDTADVSAPAKEGVKPAEAPAAAAAAATETPEPKAVTAGGDE